jgi:hypothetical protein
MFHISFLSDFSFKHRYFLLSFFTFSFSIAKQQHQVLQDFKKRLSPVLCEITHFAGEGNPMIDVSQLMHSCDYSLLTENVLITLTSYISINCAVD